MQYLGGKSRLAKHIAQAILTDTDRRDTYIEPMIGGGSVFCAMAPHFDNALGGDIHPDLILLYRAVANGWLPPEHLSEAEYRELRHTEPSALRGFAGFGCSFAGRWFEGYARNKIGVNYAARSYRSLKRQQPALSECSFFESSYDAWIIARPQETVMYFDPPYKGTKGYSGTAKFDHDHFWDSVRDYKNQGVHVYVSEFEAPEDFECIWEKERKICVDGKGSHKSKVERLFK